jgi:hypothetical protein
MDFTLTEDQGGTEGYKLGEEQKKPTELESANIPLNCVLGSE